MGKLAITIRQGETYFHTMRLKDDAGTPVSTSGAAITSQIRRASDNTLIADFDVSLLSDNYFKLQLEASDTADIVKQQGLMWDVRFETSGGVVYKTDPDTVTIVNSMTEP